MKNNKTVVGLLMVVVVLIFGFVTKQALTQIAGENMSFTAQVAKVFQTNSNLNTAIQTPPETPPGRGGPGDSGPDGWTQFNPSSTSQIVYISANGSDTANCVYTLGGSRPFGGNDPFNPTNPITPCKSLSLFGDTNKIRSGQDDFFLLKRGDTWNTSGTAITLNKSGFSPTRKMVIGSWAPASAPNVNRPKLLAAPIAETKVIISNGGCNNLALVDVHVALNTSESAPITLADGLNIYTCQNGTSNFHLENMYFERFTTNIVFYSNDDNGCASRARDYVIRRNIISDSLGPVGSDSHGMLAMGDNFIIEENIFTRNGCGGTLNPCVSQSSQGGIRSHSAYLTMNTGNTRNVNFSKNFILRGTDGGKLGSDNGGLINDNTFSGTAIAALSCCGSGQTLTNNVAVDARDYNSGTRRGNGFYISIANSLVKGNIFAHQRTSLQPWEMPAMRISGGSNSQITENIVYNWCGSATQGSAIWFESNGYPSTLSVNNNEFQQDCPSGYNGHIYLEQTALGASSAQFSNNKYYTNIANRFVAYGGGPNAPTANFDAWRSAVGGETGSTVTRINYLDPNRDISTYHNLLFGTTHAFASDAGLLAFDAKLRAQSKWNWDNRLTAAAFNDYIRCGFNKAPLNGSCPGGGTGDTQAPSVSLTAPANGATVSGTVAVSATATDNVGVTRVEFYRGTTLLGTDTTATGGNQYSVNWNTTQSTNGPHSITARAYDAANNIATSQPRNVTVNNSLSASCLRIDADQNNTLNSNDFSAFQSLFASSNMRADIDQNTYLNANDFMEFINIWAGCPHS